MITKKMIGSAIAVAAFGFAATASAGFTNEDLASWHGSANSSYYSWDNYNGWTKPGSHVQSSTSSIRRCCGEGIW